jgi:proteasome lid subunit RPN8/RPN11
MKKTKFILPYNEKRRLHYHAFRAQQKDQSEVCGVVLVGLDRKIRLQFLPNLSTSSCSFEVSIRDVNVFKRQVAEQGMRVIGIFHSHIVSEAILGPYDLQEAPLSYMQLIYDICGRQVRMWRIKKITGEKVAIEVPLTVESRSKLRTSH